MAYQASGIRHQASGIEAFDGLMPGIRMPGVDVELLITTAMSN